MYQIFRRSAERPWELTGGEPDGFLQPGGAAALPFMLRMRENRSQLSKDGHAAIAALAVLFMATTLVFAFKGLWLIPLFSITAMGVLTFVLDRHARKQASSETLELSETLVRLRDRAGRVIELPAFWLRFHAERRSPGDLRLILRSGERRIEFGHCLSLHEKREVASIVSAALAQVRGG